MIRRIDQELRGELGKPHHWGVEIKWGKRNKKEISKKNHKIINIYIFIFYYLFYFLFLQIHPFGCPMKQD